MRKLCQQRNQSVRLLKKGKVKSQQRSEDIKAAIKIPASSEANL